MSKIRRVKFGLLLLNALFLSACSGYETETVQLGAANPDSEVVSGNADSETANSENSVHFVPANSTNSVVVNGSGGLPQTIDGANAVDQTVELNTPDVEIQSEEFPPAASHTVIASNINQFNNLELDSGVVVSLRGSDLSTAVRPDGSFELVVPITDEDRSLSLDITGVTIVPKSVSVAIPALGERVSIDIDVAARAVPLTFNLDVGGQLRNLNSVTNTSVTVAANAFQLADGTIAVGDAQVSITEIDINDLDGDSAWAPNLVGISQGMNEASALKSYGMSDYYFSQFGEALQLRPGATATLKTELLPALVLQEGSDDPDALAEGDTVPLWFYDTQDMVWKEEGISTVIADSKSASGFSLSGDVSHFSSWNHDKRVPGVLAKVVVNLVGEDGLPYDGVSLKSFRTVVNSTDLGNGRGRYRNRRNMIPGNNEILVAANEDQRFDSRYRVTMGFDITNLVLEGFGDAGNGEYTGEKAFKLSDDDHTIYIDVPVTKPEPITTTTNVVVELVDLQGRPYTDLTVESYRVIARDDERWSSVKDMTPQNNDIVVQTNEWERIRANETITMDITVDNLQVSGYGKLLVPAVSRSKVFREGASDSIVIQVPASELELIPVMSNIKIELVDRFTLAPRPDLVVQSYLVTAQTGDDWVKQEDLTPQSNQIEVLANDPRRIEAGKGVSTLITLEELYIQGDGRTDLLNSSITHTRIFSTDDDNYDVTLVVPIIDM